MVEIVNLNRFKKAKAKDAQTKTADANRIKFGATKSEKTLVKKQSELAKNKLDGHKREDT
jgi:hypothetical protein